MITGQLDQLYKIVIIKNVSRYLDNSRKSCEIEMNNVLNAENKSENYCN